MACRYVEQNDIHSPQVTVGESLMFSAQLRLMDVKKHDLTLFVNEVSMLSYACLPGIRALPALETVCFQTKSGSAVSCGSALQWCWSACGMQLSLWGSGG